MAYIRHDKDNNQVNPQPGSTTVNELSGNDGWATVTYKNFNADYVARNTNNTSRTPGTYQARNTDNTTRTPASYNRHDDTCLPQSTLDFRFAQRKSLTDQVSGKNLITFTRAGTATYVDANRFVKTAAVNEPRFDHNPTTGECKGLLIEDSRTNLFTYSTQFDQTHWDNVRSTEVIASTIEDPQGDGSQTAFKLIATTDNNTHRLDKINLSMATSRPHTMSVWAKAGEYTGVSLTIADTSNNQNGVYFDLSAGTFTTSGVNYNGKMDAYPNGWYRCFATITSTGADINSLSQRCLIGVLKDGSTHTYEGDGTSGIYIWGAQLIESDFNLNSIFTSYIPTEGSTVARAAEVVEVTGTNFTSFYNQSEGTFFVDALSTGGRILGVSDGTDSNRQDMMSSAANNMIFQKRGGTMEVNLNEEGMDQKSAFSYASNDYSISGGGSTVTAAQKDTSATPPTGMDRMKIGVWFNNTDQINGYIRRIGYLSYKVSDTILPKFTT